MKRFAGVVLASAALIAAASPAFAREVATQPGWFARTPNGESFARRYPKTALAKGETGVVVLSCTTTADRLLDCAVVDENPVDSGFAAVALDLSHGFLLTAAGAEALKGNTIRLPISFRMGN
jgi:hypothetical protein